MTPKQIHVEHVLEFARTPLSRSTVFGAAMAFAVCHIVALSTEPSALDLNEALPQQLLHFGAVLCRFLLPFSVMVAGVASYVSGRMRQNVSRNRLRSP